MHYLTVTSRNDGSLTSPTTTTICCLPAALDEFNNTPNQPYTLPIMIGQVYAALGDADRAMEWLEKDHEERDPWLMWIKVNPVFEPIRHDARIQQLLARIGLGSG